LATRSGWAAKSFSRSVSAKMLSPRLGVAAPFLARFVARPGHSDNLGKFTVGDTAGAGHSQAVRGSANWSSLLVTDWLKDFQPRSDNVVLQVHLVRVSLAYFNQTPYNAGMEDHARQGEARSIREKADQDLAGVRSRITEAEVKLMELRSEERELQGFIRRLDRYDPRPAETVTDANFETRVYFAGRGPRRTKLEPLRIFGSGPITRIETICDDGQKAPQTDVAIAPLVAADARTPLIDLTEANEEMFARSGWTLIHPTSAAGSTPRAGSRRARVSDIALSVVDLLGGAVPTKTILDHIRTDAEVFGYLGTKPDATLSSYLSRDPRLLFDRAAGGWTMNPSYVDDLADQDGAPANGGTPERSVSQ